MNLKEAFTAAESKIFKHKPMDTDIQKPVEEVSTPDADGEKKESAEIPVKEAPRTDMFVPHRPGEDAPLEGRAAYNCPDCKGEGLKDEYTFCPKCKGTGKV